jgi:hypothetical protein
MLCQCAEQAEVERDNAPARKLYAGAGFEAREKYVLMLKDIHGIA